MVKKIALIVSILSTPLAYSTVHIVGRLEITRKGETKILDFDKIVDEESTQIITHEEGSLTGTAVVGSDQEKVFFTGDITDKEGTKILNPTLICTYNQEASVKIVDTKNNAIAEELALYVTPLNG